VTNPYPPERQGLYDPRFEHDGCGVGFVCHIDGLKSHDVITQGLQVLVNLTHRGAAGADPDTGDGAGFLIQTPHRFLEKVTSEIGVELPEPGDYGVAVVFLPTDEQSRSRCTEAFETIVAAEGQRFLGWRDVPHDPSAIGEGARRVLPVIRHALVGRGSSVEAGDAFERKLFVIRKRTAIQIRGEGIAGFHIASFSARTICYKGLLLAHQIEPFYPDLRDETMESALALVHQRYSTNTWPTWDLAQPFRFLCHNGEINTLRGNVNWMRAREAVMSSPLFGDDLKRVFPLITPKASDSAQIDNALEFLVLAGRSLPHAMMMLIPEPWDKDKLMPDDKRAFYEYHSCLNEPWDGPASIAFTDGTRIGAVLDRNGLRPSRYVVTKDDFVVMASEVGVLEIPPENVKLKGRLQPGRMFLIDTEQGRIIHDTELKQEYASRRPYRKWVSENEVTLNDLPDATLTYRPDPETRFARQRMFGYTLEELRMLLAPMAEKAAEAVGSMGNDAPLAVLSENPQLLYNYFKQVFAQVTNPAIDSIREVSVMSLLSTIGTEGNLLDETPEQGRMIRLDQPILSNRDLERIRQIDRPYFQSVTLAATFKANGGLEVALRSALDRLRREATEAIRAGANILILSDREAGPDQIPIPSLLATSAVHHHLIREGLRTRCGIIVESGEAREVAHFALLIGYGAAAICPYLAVETIEEIAEEGVFVSPDLGAEEAVANYVKGVGKGLLKIFAKMGISTLLSYRGAQLFEAVGIEETTVEEFFTGTSSRVGGIGLEVIAREAQMRHEHAFGTAEPPAKELDIGGQYQWRRHGERHLLNPSTVHKLQQAVRTGRYDLYREFADEINDQTRSLFTIRGMLRFKTRSEPIPLDQVEPASEIAKRFCTGAMSFGSISAEAHETLAIAMNRIGGKSNSGEGGEDPSRFTPDPNGDWRRSAIKQVASGRFGVTSWYLTNAVEHQIKISQGAKPGEGGQLPGHKVDRKIARVRNSTPGVGLISPPPHHDIYSIEDLAQLIHDLKNSNPSADISVKLVSVSGVGTIAAGVAKGHAETVLVVGHDGGTGASPQTSIKHAGVPWEIGLAETQQALVLNELRGRIRVHVDGQLRTGRDVVIGALLGADEYGFGTIALVALGCIMMRVCHLNTCPVGIATQDEELRKKFNASADHAVNYMMFVAQDVREIMAQLGFRTVDEMIGQVDRLEPDPTIEHWKLPNGLDWDALLYEPEPPHPGAAIRHTHGQEHGLENALDNELIRLCEPALERREPVEIDLPIRNVNRTVGTMLGHELSKRYGEEGLPEDTIQLRLHGSAGQSFGAFVPRGITLTLSGDANDYTGKGLSGGRLIVFPPEAATFDPATNILVGNVVLYGATGGEAFFRGVAGERFCVRNSGALAVVEGVGDHGCEYMTGGRAVILGPTGSNFAAGMSGGIAWVLDPDNRFLDLCNTGMVELERVEDERREHELRELIEKHHRLTGSERAEGILERWEKTLPQFVQVFPTDYKRALAGVEFGSANEDG
jgi:glutamate synthase domain-containing protein 2/glutamate synthase domain-containing protein 1/glutamate synthase domain-containing protein 3